jgi:acyl-CoA thioester hydrolase
MEGYNTELNLRIDWSEMDLFGHVNNVSFFKYIQASRVNYWEQIGLNKLHKESNQGPMLASASCQFKKPLFFPGNISIVSKIGFIKTSSFSIQHLILNEKGEIAAEAEDVVVFFDFNKHEKLALTKALLQKIESIEKKIV